jgi:hypothetical protein
MNRTELVTEAASALGSRRAADAAIDAVRVVKTKQIVPYAEDLLGGGFLPFTRTRSGELRR